jgi:hypothetical protein
VTVPRATLTTFDQVALAVGVVSVGTLLLELSWPHELDAPAVADESPAELEQATPDVIPVTGLHDYVVVSERPLFAFDRRPYVPVVEVAPAPSGPRAEFQLTALIVTGTTQIALLRSNLTPTVQRVALNQSIDGWTLAEVHPDSVLLRRDAESMSVQMRRDPGVSTGQGARVSTLASGN